MNASYRFSIRGAKMVFDLRSSYFSRAFVPGHGCDFRYFISTLISAPGFHPVLTNVWQQFRNETYFYAQNEAVKSKLCG
jgi:hypothetical protein